MASYLEGSAKLNGGPPEAGGSEAIDGGGHQVRMPRKGLEALQQQPEHLHSGQIPFIAASQCRYLLWRYQHDTFKLVRR